MQSFPRENVLYRVRRECLEQTHVEELINLRSRQSQEANRTVVLGELFRKWIVSHPSESQANQGKNKKGPLLSLEVCYKVESPM